MSRIKAYCRIQPDDAGVRRCTVCGVEFDGNPRRPCVIPGFTVADATILITCFMRFDRLRKLLWSIRRFYPGVPVVVADNTLQDGEEYPAEIDDLRNFPGVRWVRCDYDCGVAGIRNRGFKLVETPVTILCEEDFIFTEETRLECLLEVLDIEGVDLAAGLYRDGDPPSARNWSGRFRFIGHPHFGRYVEMVPLSDNWNRTDNGTWWRWTDIVHNFFATRTDLLLSMPQDETFKASTEHLDWLLTWHRAKKRLAYTPQCVVLHDNGKHSDPEYWKHRSRFFRDELWSKWNLCGHKELGIVWEPGLNPLRPAHSASNVIVLTVGKSGSTILCDLMRRLGWNLGAENDSRYNEPEDIRRINDRILSGEQPPLKEMEDVLSAQPQPWCLKDPRFCFTLEHWLPVLRHYQPRLIWMTRDHELVRESYGSETEYEIDPDDADVRLRFAERSYEWWPWEKSCVDLSDLSEWAAHFDHERAV